MKTRVLLLLLVIATPLVAAHAGETHTGGSAEPCPEPRPAWQDAMEIAGVEIQESERCKPDNPYVVASSVKGTNNVPMDVLMRSGLSRDAVVKRNDIDGDGDPDEIHITLEIMGINEFNESNVVQEIAPGIKPAFWVFAPKGRGMLERGSRAEQLVRMPSPTIRVEEGDRVFLHVENAHYMPHTVHLHGVDHPYSQENVSGGDGVPQTGEEPIPPGESRTYRFTPREEGTMMYHCHVVPNVHVMMGLNGMFVVEEEAENNTIQTLNVGAGKVRHPSETVEESHSAEYDMVYQNLDRELHRIPKQYDDTRKIVRQMNRVYDITDASYDYFLLNGKSFPYTLRESIIKVRKNRKYLVRVLNSGSQTVSLHTHGHKFTVEARDGVELDENNEVQRDVATLSAAQRLKLTLNTTDNGLDSYGSGAWLFHDHTEEAVTTDGISPGGNIGMIAYRGYLDSNGMPAVDADLEKYFNESYYEGEIPFFAGLEEEAFGRPPGEEPPELSHPDPLPSAMPSMRMEMVPNGTVVNGNSENLPEGCERLRGTRNITIEAGREFAGAGEVYSYRRNRFEFGSCQRVNVRLVNHDEVRHQWMLHGLPRETYPGGMFNVEAKGEGTVRATFITPAEPQQLQLHCSLPQHQQKGMKGEVVIGPDKVSLLERLLSLL